MEKKITLKQIAMVGVMAAAVYVASAFLQKYQRLSIILSIKPKSIASIAVI